MKKQLSLVLTAVMVAASLAACGGSSQPAATTAAAAPAETQAAAADAAAPAETEAAAPAAESSGKTELKVIYTTEPSNLLPGSEAVSSGHFVQCNLFDTLVMETNGDRSTLIPGLATEWEYSEDGTAITFTLREGVKFHDGETMTADDVVFSLQKDAEGSYNADAATLIDSIEKVDDTHVKVTTKYAYKPFLQVLSMPSFGIYSQKWYEDCEANGTNMARAENGTGAYKFVDWKAGDYITLDLNP